MPVARRKQDILANDLRKDILSGKYGTEGGIPGLDELVRRSGLARNTVRAAMTTLEEEKLIVEQDRNYFVNPLIVTTMTQYVLPVAIRMQKYARSGKIVNLEDVRRTWLPEHLQYRLGLTPVSVVFQACSSIECKDSTETPMQIAHYYYFMPLSDKQIQNMQADAAYDVLLECEDELVRRDEISTRLPTNSEIEILRIPSGMPVLTVSSTVYDKTGSILLFQELTRIPRAVLEYRYSFKNRAQ